MTLAVMAVGCQPKQIQENKKSLEEVKRESKELMLQRIRTAPMVTYIDKDIPFRIMYPNVFNETRDSKFHFAEVILTCSDPQKFYSIELHCIAFEEEEELTNVEDMYREVSKGIMPIQQEIHDDSFCIKVAAPNNKCYFMKYVLASRHWVACRLGYPAELDGDMDYMIDLVKNWEPAYRDDINYTSRK